MSLHGVDAERQVLANFTVGHACGEKIQDFSLAFAQSCRVSIRACYTPISCRSRCFRRAGEPPYRANDGSLVPELRNVRVARQCYEPGAGDPRRQFPCDVEWGEAVTPPVHH